MNYIIFGGTGFIGTHLINLLKAEAVNPDDKIYALDIVMPGEEGVVPGVVEKIECVEYVRCDVRKPIDFDITTTTDDIIFNFAAVHRTPGHPDYEYFETNLYGAENVTAFAVEHGITKILFTSSIAPYGAAEEFKEETTLPTPNTAYGISKLVAEKIHEKWQAGGPKRELTIVRPGVVYGKGEHGNFTRLYWGQRKHYFFYPGRKDTVKACIYVKELVRFMKYRMIDNDFPGVDVFNSTFEPAYNMEQICSEMQKATDMKRFVPLIPGWILMTAAVCLVPFGGMKLGLHPARVKKLMISTNICGKKLAASGYKFYYTFEETLRDWFEDCGREGLE
ncbi:NAD(P)-dependent oxidoreductase [Desulfosporosinus fructosivorans]|uniref:NAD(P)-dependent oxidoreductase n=1 Tax=Desulfosporosinus fructosivorans TaxID=2018669 RepID=A0A4Z0R9B3_9FIRM|nr:NAD(P)-dependent oxidoreductase [Desulfosporosinus fructosivorans]TGE39732.1 NAD(P)-dependent oxidoreductase [Desulfosporosinus fructosivorans]